MRNPMLRVAVLVAVAVLSLTFVGCGGGGGGGGGSSLDVLVVYSTGVLDATDILDKLASSGAFDSVTGFDAFVATPTLAQLQGYHAVLVVPNSGFADSTTLGNNLAAYSDGGGGVVAPMFESAAAYIAGAWGATPDYHAFTGAGQIDGDGPIGWSAVLPADPILGGVFLFGGGTSSYRPNTLTVTAGSTLVASWLPGQPLIARRATIYGSRIVDLGFYPATSDVSANYVDASTDAMLIVVNSLRWVAGDL